MKTLITACGKQHFQRGQASTELEIYKVERLALNNAYLATTV